MTRATRWAGLLALAAEQPPTGGTRARRKADERRARALALIQQALAHLEQANNTGVRGWRRSRRAIDAEQELKAAARELRYQLPRR